jgi:hypothetical protein
MSIPSLNSARSDSPIHGESRDSEQQPKAVQLGSTPRTVKDLSSFLPPLAEIRAGLVRIGSMISLAGTEFVALGKRVVGYAKPMTQLTADLKKCIERDESTVNPPSIKQLAIEAARHLGRSPRASAVADFYEDLGEHLSEASPGDRALFLQQTFREFARLGSGHLKSIGDAVAGLATGLDKELASSALKSAKRELDAPFAQALNRELKSRYKSEGTSA